MKKISLLFFLCIFAWVTKAQTAHADYQDGKIWFRIKKDYRVTLNVEADLKNLPFSTLPFMSKLDKNAGITKLSKPFHIAKRSPELQRVFLLEFTNYNSVETLIRQMEASGAVDYAEKVPLTRHALTVNDPSYSSQWGLSIINAPTAWNYFSTGSNIVVAVVDDAVERTHPDLAPNIWVNPGEIAGNSIDDDGNGYVDDINGYDVADNDNNPNPPSSAFDHGTHVAGIVGARSNNSTGVASIGFSVKLMCVKSTNSSSSVTNGYDGVLYATETGADVINMSWGGAGSSITAQNIIDYAYDQGVVLIAAAGNSNVNTMFYPAAYTNVIAVAATTSSDTKASFSNYGTWVDVSAPGNNIYSTTVGGTYGNKSGTSMASPMVAGLAGLMLSLNPSLTNDDIRNCIQTTAVNINSLNPGYVGQLGSGRIDANAAMNCVSATLSWPPSADFVANTTTVTAGGSVNFTDQSVYSPTSWTWSFPGGTPSSYVGVNPPSITYSTAGVYNVSLTVSNVNGTDVETKTSYITVNPAGGCYGMNFPPPATWTPVNYITGTGGADGFVNGQNIYADKEKAMYYDASATPYTYMNTVYIAFGAAYSNNPADIVPVKVYNGTGGTVGALLGTTNLTMGQIMSDVAGGYFTEASFVGTPIALPASKQFFVSVDISNLSWTGTPKDSISIVSNTNGQTTPSAIWEKQSDNLWYHYTTAGTWNLNASLYIHPFLTTTPTNATFTSSATTICEDNSITFNAAGSTYEDTLLWVFNGGSPLLSNNVSQSVLFNNPGTYTVKLYVVGGGCGLLDSAEVNITVNPKPLVSVSATPSTVCVGGSSNLTASGATSYTWAPSTFLSGTTGSAVTSTPTSTIQYTVTGTGASGCQNSTLVEIIVNNNPVANATVDNDTICTGTSINFDGSLSDYAGSFNWTLTGGSPASSTGTGGTTSYATAGTYTVSLQVTNSCGTDTDTKNVVVSNAPAVSFNFVGGDSVCTTAGTITMNGTPAGGTFSGTAVTGNTFDPAAAGVGSYTITYTYVDGSSGCTATVNNDIVVQNCLSAMGIAGGENFAVYPNPAAYTLNVQGSVDFNRVQLMDMTGRLVTDLTTVVNKKATLTLNNLPNGMYTVRIMNNQEMVYQNKLVISK